MNQEERSERLKVLRRKENREKLLPEFLVEMNIISGKYFSENDVLSLEQIDENQIRLNGSDFDFNFLNISFPVNKLDELKKLLSVLENDISQNNFLLLIKYMDFAVLNVNTDFVISNIEKLITLDGNTFKVYDHQYENGFWIDFYQEHWFLDGKAERTWIYELRVFGKSWMKKIARKI